MFQYIKTICIQLESLHSSKHLYDICLYTSFVILVTVFSGREAINFHFCSFTGLCAVCAMSLFSWMRRSNGTRAQPKDEATPLKTTGAAASHTLMGELLWHLEEHEPLAREPEREPVCSGRGPDWFEKYPKLRNLISTSELQQLELLCSQIPPVHAAAVLSR